MTAAGSGTGWVVAEAAVTTARAVAARAVRAEALTVLLGRVDGRARRYGRRVELRGHRRERRMHREHPPNVREFMAVWEGASDAL
ncbi:hypothetical protein GCM10010230_37110 [Streptomyces narbonensis]|nr:hypothetical protein GCM10010230_37110 [Streptomyces narbonensis]